ncbi:MAG: hypothetical protein GX444_20905 [Myxococcales bacterium]|nr:hypothetical protein [Myxococcales bacterium]
MQRIILLALTCLILLVAIPAFAGLGGTGLNYGFGARGIALGGAYSALSGDSSSAFFNPAAMAMLETSQIGLSYLYAQPEFSGGPKGDPYTFDHSNKIIQANLATKLNTLFKTEHPFFFGLNIALDDNTAAFIRFRDVQNPEGEYIRYGSFGFTLNATLGFGITDWLYLGGGVLTTLHATSQFTVSTDLSGKTQHEGNTLESDTVFAPLASALLHFDLVDIGATFHGRHWGQLAPITVEAEANVGSSPLASLPMKLYYKDNYSPHRVGLGTYWRPLNWMNIAADVVWLNWGDFDDEITIDDLPRRDIPIEFKDIFVPHLGLEFVPIQNLFVRSGYYYEDSPIVKGGTSQNMMLDNTKHVGSAGVGYNWQNPPLLRYPLGFDAAYILQYLVPRDMESSDSKKYESSGYMNGVVATLTLRY